MNERVAAKPKQASPKTQPPARSGASSVRTGTGALPPVVHEVLRSPGQPLDPATRAFAEPRFGHDFGRVRVHDDVRSAEAARQLDSVAFTSGQHVFFGTGAYRPETPTGRRLLAHELAHTLQQREAQPSVGNPVIQSNPIVSRPGDRLEREAEAAAERVAAGGRLAPGSISPAGTRALISRQVATLAAREPAGTRLEAEELVEDLAQTILGDLRRDPGDVSGSTHRRLNRLDPSTREAVLERIESLATPDQSMRLAQILAAPAPPEVETPQETEEAYRPEPEDRAPLPEPAPEAVPETSRPETEEIRPGVSPERETAPPAGVAGVATTGEMGAAPPAATPGPTEAPAGAAPLPAPEAAGDTEPAAAPGEVVEAAPAAPEGPQPETGDVPVPQVQADIPDATAEAAGAAPPVAAAPGPTETPAGAAPLPTSEDATPEADTGPIEELEAEAEELGAEEEEPEAEPEDRAALPEPAPEAAEMPPPEAGLAEPAEAGSDLASPEPTLEGAPEEPAAEEAAPVEAPLGPEEAGVEGFAEGGELGAPEPAPGAEMNLGDVDLGAALEEDAGAGGEAPAGGGGGGGTPIPEPPTPETPDVSQADPAQALATVSALPPSRLAVALGGVSAAASRSVSEQRTELASNPPEVERPSGAHGTGETLAAESQAPPVDGPRRVERVPEGRSAPVPRPAPLPPAPPPPTELVRPPQVGNTPQGAPSAEEAAALRTSLRRLPTHDPALDVTAGPPPTLALEGDADPERARDQRTRLAESVAEAREQGQRDRAAAQQVGMILPDVPQETLRAEVPTGEGGGAAGSAPAASAGAPASGAGEGDDEAASIIAQEQQGDQIRASIAQAQADVSARRQEHTSQVAEHRAGAQREMDELVNANASEQARERTAAHSEVQELGSEWDEAQRGLVDSSRTEADTVAREGAQDLTQERTQAEERAAQHVQDGNREAATAREQAEQQAARERQSAEQESGGILSWVAKQATDFFNAVKNRIQQAFEAARALVRDAIQRAQRLAADAIEAARRNIVGIIRRVGDALISIGDRLLAGFPGLRDRFRAAIRERVAKAEAAVNRLAGALKEGVQRALNFLGSALNAALGLLERGMLAAVDAANRAVQGAIQFARSVVQGFAAFAALIRDVAANPGQWIRNLGAAVMDGIRNHLWAALKTAIREWFNSKVEEVLGLGMMVWRLLSQGGIAIAQVGRMVWEGLKQAIPMALIQILIQRLVAMIVPAVGAVMVIIETLQAAWGTVSRIIQAFERFFAFLRAVRTGNAGPQFAQALAAASVAVIDFVSNFLLTRLRRPAGALAGRIRAIAQRIGERLKRLTQTIRGGLRAAPTRFRSLARRRRGKTDTDAQRRSKEQRQRRAEARTKVAIDAAAARGNLTHAALKVMLRRLKTIYGWKTLDVVSPETSEEFEVYGGFSPAKPVAKGKVAREKALKKALTNEVENRLKVIVAIARDQVFTDPFLTRGELDPFLSEAEREVEKRKPFLDRANFGKAVERAVAFLVARDTFLRTYIVHEGYKSGVIDFKGRGKVKYKNRVIKDFDAGFEITTDVPSTVRKHELRAFYDANRDRIIKYKRYERKQ